MTQPPGLLVSSDSAPGAKISGCLYPQTNVSPLAVCPYLSSPLSVCKRKPLYMQTAEFIHVLVLYISILVSKTVVKYSSSLVILNQNF